MSSTISEEDIHPGSPTGETGQLFSNLEDNNFKVYCLDVTLENNVIQITTKYGDLYQLNEQLKVLFPSIQLLFPPMVCKEKVTEDILIERQCGLEQFIENVVCHRRMINSQPVKDFVGIGAKVLDISIHDQAFNEVLHLQDESFFAGEGLGILQDIHISDENIPENDKELASPQTIIEGLQEDIRAIGNELETVSEIGLLPESMDQLENVQLAVNTLKGEMHNLREHMSVIPHDVEDTNNYNTNEWSYFFDKLAKAEMKQSNSKSPPYDDMSDMPTEASNSGTDDDPDYATSGCLPSIPEYSTESATAKVNAFASQWMKRGKQLIKSTMEIAKPAAKTSVAYRKDAGNEVEFKESTPKSIASMNTKIKDSFVKNELRVVQHSMRRASSCESLQWEELY